MIDTSSHTLPRILSLLSAVFMLAGCMSPTQAPTENAPFPPATPRPATVPEPSTTAVLDGGTAPSSNPSTGQHAFTSQIADRSYLLFLPAQYGKDPALKWPLILFLHGAGTRSTNTDMLRFEALPQILEFTPEFPFIVLSPQLTGEGGDEYWFQAKPEESVFELLDEILAGYAVDRKRVYLTGVSIGGNGVWEYGLSHPASFAALVPVMGFVGDTAGYSVPDTICDLKEVPVWAFHGAKDSIVPLEAEQALVNALITCGGNVQFTVFPEGDHDISGKVFPDQELYTWLLSQSLK